MNGFTKLAGRIPGETQLVFGTDNTSAISLC